MKLYSLVFSKILPHTDYSVENSFVLVGSIPGSSISHFLFVLIALKTHHTAWDSGTSLFSSMGSPLLFHCMTHWLPGALCYGSILLEHRLLRLFRESCMDISDSDSFK